ncbi:MAG: hypothetical protein WCL61_02120, partial [bacterium]
LLDQMSSYDIRFKIGRPGKITAYMYLCDADDHVVFFCQKSADPVIIKGGGYELPYDFGDMLLGMADIVQLTPPDPDSVKQARICVRNQDGTFKFSEWLTVNADGTIQSATSYCSQQGELVVCRERDGQRWEDWYDLQTGKVLSQEVVMTRFLTKIKDCYDFGVNPYCANIHLWPSMDGLYSNTTVNFTVKGGAKVGLYAWVFNADGRFVQAAYCFVYRKVGETEWTGRKYLTPGEDWSLSLPDDAEIEGCYLFQNLPEANATPVFYDPNAKG